MARGVLVVGDIPARPILARCFGQIGRMLIIQLVWVTMVGLGAASYQAGASRIEAFAAHFALASAVSAIVTLAVGGAWRRGVEISISTVALIVTTSILAYSFFWLTPVQAKSWLGLGLHDLWRVRHNLKDLVKMLSGLMAAISFLVGVGFGIVAGGLMRLAGRKPRLAGTLAMGILVAFGSSASYQSSALTSIVLESRGEGGQWLAASISETELASTIGAVTGAVAGAMIGCITMRLSSARARSIPSKACQ
jgi:hypothetical protein